MSLATECARALTLALAGLLWACTAPGTGAHGPPLPDRAEFARKMALVEVGMTRAEVVDLLGPPSRVVPKSELHTAGTELVLGYGADNVPGKIGEVGVFASLGSVYIDRQDRVQYVFGKGSHVPIDLPERELRSLLDLLDRTPSYQQLSDYRPSAVIHAVNALLPLGKDEALAVIDEYLRVASQYHSTAREGLFLVLRTMFDVPEDPGHHPRMLVGGPIPAEPADRTVFPRFPIALVDDIPYLLVRGYELGGEAEPVASHVARFRAEGVLRRTELRPGRKGRAALEALRTRARIELDAGDDLLGQLERQWKDTTGVKVEAGSATPRAPLPRVGITARHVDSDFRYAGDRVQVLPQGTSIQVIKTLGPTVQILIGEELIGDFEACLGVEFPSRSEPGARSGGGGTAIPYFGFRSSDGKLESTCHAPPLAAEAREHAFVIRRRGDRIAVDIDGEPRDVVAPKNGAPGYVFVHMNDLAKFTLASLSVTEPGTSNEDP